MAIEAAALGAGVLAYASKDVVTKLLGPTAEYLGGELRDFVTRRQQIAGRIFQNAATKAASRLDQPGCVPPHVLKDVISDGTFQDNDFAVEYFGGVLASSRTEVDRDDSAATYSAMLARMSAYQIRAHYIFYSIFKLLYDGKDAQISQGKFRARMRTYVSYKSFALGMEFTKAELEKFDVIISHVLYGLLKEDLIGERYQAGNPATLSVPDVEEGWIRAGSDGTRSGAVHARPRCRLPQCQRIPPSRSKDGKFTAHPDPSTIQTREGMGRLMPADRHASTLTVDALGVRFATT